MTAPKLELHISSKLRQALPPLTEDEKKLLEENLVRDGRVLNPIRYWHDGEKALIVDGMNRYPIALQHNLPFTAEGMEFPDIDAVVIWIKEHALGQRNLTPDAKKRLAGELYNARKGKHGGRAKADGTPRPNVAKEIGELTGMHPISVVQAGKMVEALGKLPAAMRDAINDKTHPASEKMILALAERDRATQQKVWADVRTGRQPTIEAAAAVHGVKVAKPKPKPVEKTAWDDVPLKFHDRLKFIKATPAEVERLSRLNTDHQEEVIKLLGDDHQTLTAAIDKWEGPAAGAPAEAPAAEKKEQSIKQHLAGMKATIDTLRNRVDLIVAELGKRPDPDYAQQVLDGLETARVALAKWARKA